MSYLSATYVWIVGIIGSSYMFITGHTHKDFQILLGVMILDIISGIMKGIQKKRLKSTIMTLGIMKKGAIMLSIVFAGLLDQLFNPGEMVFMTMMTWLAIGNESLSIIENLVSMGVKIPDAIKCKLEDVVASVCEVEDLKNEISKDDKNFKKGDR